MRTPSPIYFGITRSLAKFLSFIFGSFLSMKFRMFDLCKKINRSKKIKKRRSFSLPGSIIVQRNKANPTEMEPKKTYFDR